MTKTTSYPRCVGTKRGKNYGIVYATNGQPIGRVFRHKRVAAGTKGARAPFWTAVAFDDTGAQISGPSLGTRHPSRHSAVSAVREFAATYHGVAVARLITEADRLAYREAQGWPSYPLSTWDRWAMRRCYARAVARFKYDEHAVCAIPKRYRGKDPRVVEREAAQRTRVRMGVV